MRDRLTHLLPSGTFGAVCVAGVTLAVSSLIDCAVKADVMLGWTLPVGMLAVALVFLWLTAACRKGVLFVDQTIPASLVAVGLLGLVLPLVPPNLLPVMLAFKMVASAALAAFWIRGHGRVEGDVKGAPPRRMLAKPLAYLVVYVVVTCLCFGLILKTYFPDFGLFYEGMGFALGVVAAGLSVYAARILLNAKKGLDVLTRFSLVSLILAWLLFLQSSLSEAALCMNGIGFGVFSFITVRLVADLYKAFRLKASSAVCIFLAAMASMLVGSALGWLLATAGVLSDMPAIVVVAAIAAVTIVTVYGLSSDRIWTAEGFSEEGNIPSTKGGRWRSACAATAEDYSLTPREAEVLFLLSKGRNAAYIEDELVVSPHTVKSHMLNIYRKLGVHSQQELITCVESHLED